MVIIWGTKPYFKTKKVKSHGFCAHCQQFVKRSSFNAKTFFHLYYIPLIPTSARVRHHQMCPKCSKYLAFPLEQFAATVVTLKARCAEAIMALAEGESKVTFADGDSESEPVACIDYLIDAVDWLHDAAEQGFVDGVVEKLRQTKQSFAEQAIQAELSRIQGRRREAIDQLQAILNSHGIHSGSAKRRAALLTVEKRHVESAEAWSKALSVESDARQKVRLLALRVDALMAGKQWTEAVKVYADLLVAAPSLANDKAIKKLYAKARKKAGVM